MFTITAQNLAGVLRQASAFNSPDDKATSGFPAMVFIENPDDHRVPCFLDDASPLDVFRKSFRGMVTLLNDTQAVFGLTTISGFAFIEVEGCATIVKNNGDKVDLYVYVPKLELGNSLLQYMLYHETLSHFMEQAPGTLTVFSSNAFVKKKLKQDVLLDEAPTTIPGERFPLVNKAPFNMEEWRDDANLFLEDSMVVGLRDQFFRRVVVPLFMAGREEDPQSKLEILKQCKDTVWAAMGNRWIIRKGQQGSGEEA